MRRGLNLKGNSPKRKSLWYFFLISVLEHVFIVAIVAMLIYSEPIETLESSAIPVTIEEIKPEELPKIKVTPKKKIVAKKKEEEKSAQKKKEVPEELPTLPKMKIQDTTDASPARAESPVPQLPKTFAQIVGSGRDMVLRSPGPEEKGQFSDSAPVLGPEPTLKNPKRPALEVLVPSHGGEGKQGATTSREPKYVRGEIPPAVSQPGDLSDVARPGFVGDIRGEIAGRKVIFWPKPPEGVRETTGGTTTLEILVDPAGNVTRVKIIKKSGSPTLDRIAKVYVEQIRFERLPKNVQQKTQRGEVLINFELTKGEV